MVVHNYCEGCGEAFSSTEEDLVCPTCREGSDALQDSELRAYVQRDVQRANAGLFVKKPHAATSADYQRMFLTQGGQCAICRVQATDRGLVVRPQPPNRRGARSPLSRLQHRPRHDGRQPHPPRPRSPIPGSAGLLRGVAPTGCRRSSSPHQGQQGGAGTAAEADAVGEPLAQGDGAGASDVTQHQGGGTHASHPRVRLKSRLWLPTPAAPQAMGCTGCDWHLPLS
jgi:hypothetical protein